MKTAISLKRSADECLKRAIEEASNCINDIQRLQEGQKLEKVMPRLRLQALELEKNIHEFNAYRNAIDTN